MHDILLTTFNARYSHASLGLRYLYANMGNLQPKTSIIEFTLETRPIDALETLLSHRPRIIGLSVYIWNVHLAAELSALVKQVSPETILVLGGPEVSFEQDRQNFVEHANYVVCGNADLAFYELCTELLAGNAPKQKIITPLPFKLSDIELPYDAYSEQDLANRHLYVEASRGCPFKCEFCLSALDKTAWAFDLDKILAELERLFQRGARSFRFVDRTFNLKVEASGRILQFFLDRLCPDLFVHFEVIPDHLPDKLRSLIALFPPACLQFEVGVQSFNPDVQTLISRRQDNAKTMENLRWLREHSHAHIHADLIAGLPGEDLRSFAQGFDHLVSLRPHEIQVGILKRLRGSPIIRHTEDYQLRFNPYPPYNILSTRDLNFDELQQISRFARYWDIFGNAGRFKHSLALLLGKSPFDNFMRFSAWVFDQSRQMHKISLARQFYLMYQGSLSAVGLPGDLVLPALEKDFAQNELKGRLTDVIQRHAVKANSAGKNTTGKSAQRQSRHIDEDV